MLAEGICVAGVVISASGSGGDKDNEVVLHPGLLVTTGDEIPSPVPSSSRTPGVDHELPHPWHRVVSVRPAPDHLLSRVAQAWVAGLAISTGRSDPDQRDLGPSSGAVGSFGPVRM